VVVSRLRIWPCPTARLKLKAEYGDNRAALYIYLCGQLHVAIEDVDYDVVRAPR
jgi:hypothetical protein